MITQPRVILTTAEKQAILSRMFPNGTLRRPDDVEEHEETYLGYCRNGSIVEVRFWYGSNIDFNFQIPRNFTRRELASELVEIALEEPDTKRSEWYPHNGKFFFYVYTDHGITIVFCHQTRKLYCK